MTAANLATAWPWVVDGLIVVAAVIVLWILVDGYAMLLRPAYRSNAAQRRQDSLASALATLEAALAGLWAPEMEKRMASLVVAQQLAKSRSDAGCLAHIMIAFIRHRSRLPEIRNDSGFEDMKLALAVLGSRTVRAAQHKSKQGVDLTGVNFHGASLNGVDFEGFRLAGCVFDQCQLSSARLISADLAGASFAGADLRRADLTNADLSGADLSNADFTGAILRGTRLNSASIGGAVLIETTGLDQEQLDEALGDSDTAVPEGFRIVPMRTQRPKVAGTPPVRAAE